mmetsp:Transcript_32305/g.60822  ORF Transcript_32305/g.60822 Transcript_32305/m.60822 type:complete len:175 (+) Transcript_32305:60-584(+)
MGHVPSLLLLTQGCVLGLLQLARSADDLVALQVDLPPDIQRMFEEMCELEGVSQSEMLTRWIDARWEAMGYKDSDLDLAGGAEDADQCKAPGCSSSAPRISQSASAPEVASRNGEGATGIRISTTTATTTSAVPPRPSSVHESNLDDEEEDEEDGVPDIDTWMRRYASSAEEED